MARTLQLLPVTMKAGHAVSILGLPMAVHRVPRAAPTSPIGHLRSVSAWNCARLQVREITVDERGMANGAIYYDEEGVEQHQRAEVVIVACNGIGTPRLLLNSVSGRFPDGIANSSGLVGRTLCCTPGEGQGTFDEYLESQYGPQGCCLWSQEFYETDPERDFVRGYNLQITRDGMGHDRLGWTRSWSHSLGRRASLGLRELLRQDC